MLDNLDDDVKAAAATGAGAVTGAAGAVGAVSTLGSVRKPKKYDFL
ncbi:hypothetical protein GHO45_27995 [Pseudomonas sp. FSL R10-0765]|nr:MULTISPECIES: hypothetical protein [unclassified Pseudomonas]MQT44751.1 hypothetical protein [Pseudomonas sp. FSL R10-0765]MQT55617.1 hypothetical protein [Pseudomonas sp. FSL R10-2398]